LNRLATSSRRRLVSGLLLLFFVLAALLPAPAARAQAGIALAGTFHLQEYELPQGTEISNPSIYLVVFNHGDEALKVTMVITTPFGVEVLLGETEFTLEPGGERKLFITVRVSTDAVPGKYDLTITAEGEPAGAVSGTGAKIASASAQKASLVVSGAAATLRACVFTPDDKPIPAQIRLFKLIADRMNEISLVEAECMDIRLSPGTYRVVAYIAGRRLAEEDFDIAADETIELKLTIRTAYFEQFGIEANYVPDTDQLSFVRMVYSINNLAAPMDNVEVILQVTLDGQPLEQVSLISVPRLDLGRTGGSASYVPAAGWQPGNYAFKLDLYVEGEFYIESAGQELSVVAPLPARPTFWWFVGGVVVAIVATAAALIIWLRRRRREVPEKPEEEVPPPPAEEEEKLPEAEVEELPEAAAEERPPEEEEAVELPEAVAEEPPGEEEAEEEAEEVPEGEIEEPPTGAE